MFNKHGDKSGADVIGISCITCLAYLAILYEAVGRTEPVVAVEMYKLCDSALQNLGALTYELRLDEYTHLDLLLKVRSVLTLLLGADDSDTRLAQNSWAKSLPVFDVRIANLPSKEAGSSSKEAGSLQHFKSVVEKAHLRFETALPDNEPPVIYSLATMEDGTTVGSKYPNLMSVEARVEFGI